MLPHTLYLLSCAISLGVAAQCWRRRGVPGAGPYAVVALSQGLWTLGFIAEMMSPGLDRKLFWDNVQWLPAAVWPVAFLAFALQYTNRSPAKSRLTYTLLLIPGLMVCAAAFLDSGDGLARENTRLVLDRGRPALLYDFTPWLLGYMLYSYALAGWGLGRLALRFVQAEPLFRGQIGLVLAGTLLPAVGTLLTITILRDLPLRDISPFTFALGNLMVLVALLALRLFQVTPVARDEVVDSLPDAVLVLDADGRLVDFNPAASALVQVPRGKVIGRPAAEVLAAWPDLVDPPGALPVGRGGVREITTKDGRTFRVRNRVIREADGFAVGRVMVARDVTRENAAEVELRKYREELEDLVRERTAELERAGQRLRREAAERKELEEQFHQAQKAEAIGRLAGGVAHDFNNLLMAIMGHTELSLTSGSLTPEVRADLEGVMKACHHAAALTQQLLAFSRKQALQPVVLDLNASLRELEPMVQRLMGEDIAVVLQLDENLGQVTADPGRLQQVVMNLVVNARDAMPRGGRLVIETANVPGRAGGEPRPPEAPLGPCVRVRVSDTGAGMDADTLSHLFEPFFTTKEKGRGTGLGLSTVHGIVRQSGGAVEVASELGKGSTFTIYLPRTDGEPRVFPAAASVEEPTSGTGTILVVEDEDMVRSFVERVLRARGYRVLTARDGAEGMRVSDEFDGSIDLLVTDVVMPGGPSGAELAERLLARRPHLRVLFMSGYTDDVTLRHGVSAGLVGVLEKPFSAGVLTGEVRSMLGGERG